MPFDLYDLTGRAYAYCEDDGEIYTFGGRPVAYLYDDSVYRLDGRHVGYFADGHIRDGHGDTILFTEFSQGGPLKPVRHVKPVKGVKRVKPVKGIRQGRPVRPVSSLSWSRLPAEAYFEER